MKIECCLSCNSHKLFSKHVLFSCKVDGLQLEVGHCFKHRKSGWRKNAEKILKGVEKVCLEGKQFAEETCFLCSGSGSLESGICWECKGKGVVKPTAPKFDALSKLVESASVKGRG